jgi:transposase
MLERNQRPTNEIDELTKLRRENTELRRAVEVLKAANLCLAAQVDPTTLRS